MKSVINTTNSGAKLILLHHQSLHKQLSSSHRLSILFLLTFLTLACTLFTLTSTRDSSTTTTRPSSTATTLPSSVADALLHYASTSNTSSHMSSAELHHIATTLRHCTTPCNFLIFGLTHETFLWNSLNLAGRTVFLDESSYLVSQMEIQHPSIEAYDVQYTTKVSNFNSLIDSVNDHRTTDCRPVQNLLFSDCKLGLNDLPNFVYDLKWDLILVDGPTGYKPDSPGRMSAVFTSAVLARTNGDPQTKTHVFVRDYNRDVERISSQEFLCEENLLQVKDSLAHFLVAKHDPTSKDFRFCQKSQPLSRFQASVVNLVWNVNEIHCV
ncbi:unnamed protein product [Rhodiola kirilowii]